MIKRHSLINLKTLEDNLSTEQEEVSEVVAIELCMEVNQLMAVVGKLHMMLERHQWPMPILLFTNNLLEDKLLEEMLHGVKVVTLLDINQTHLLIKVSRLEMPTIGVKKTLKIHKLKELIGDMVVDIHQVVKTL